tara:strand:- start:4380 stop:4943 length:564 start_codon:yes stop_codon:yes gene_type:complete
MNKSKQIFLFQGAGFSIRETLEEDLPTWYKWFNNPDINSYLFHGYKPNTYEEQRLFREHHLSGKNGKIIFSITENKKNSLIGTCSVNIDFMNPAKRAEISIIIGEKTLNTGPIYFGINHWLVSHCFNYLNINSILATTSEDNSVTRLTLERVGFKKAGLMRSTCYKNGKYLNSVYYDLLKKDWDKSQ